MDNSILFMWRKSIKTFFYSLLLSTLLIAPVWADSNANEAVEEELEHRIKGKVFSIIADIIDAAGDDISENEIKNAIAEIKEIEEKNGSGHGIFIGSDDDGVSFLEALIACLAIIVAFGTPIMIVAAVLYSSYRKKRLMHDTIDQYVTSGKDIPEEVLQGLQKEVTPKSNLHKGLVMGGIGLGIFACFAVMGELEAAAIGLIPLFIGLAQLLIWKLESK